MTTVFSQLQFLEPKLQDCAQHYMPKNCSGSNFLFLASLIEKQGKSLGGGNADDLDFGFYISSARTEPRNFHYFFLSTPSLSGAHAYIYSRLDELHSVLKNRSGVLNLSSGAVLLTRDDTRKIWSEDFEVGMQKIELSGAELARHLAYSDKEALVGRLGNIQKHTRKKMM